jgi:hypothetical protein
LCITCARALADKVHTYTVNENGNFTAKNVVFQDGYIQSTSYFSAVGGAVYVVSGFMYCFGCIFRNNRVLTT